LIDFLAFVILVVLDLMHDLRLDVLLTVELEEPVCEESVGTEETVLVFDAVDLERVRFEVEVERAEALETERVDDEGRVLDGAGAAVLSLKREAFSCRYDWR
jgi:hypothetical protein